MVGVAACSGSTPDASNTAKATTTVGSVRAVDENGVAFAIRPVTATSRPPCKHGWVASRPEAQSPRQAGQSPQCYLLDSRVLADNANIASATAGIDATIGSVTVSVTFADGAGWNRILQDYWSESVAILIDGTIVSVADAAPCSTGPTFEFVAPFTLRRAETIAADLTRSGLRAHFTYAPPIRQTCVHKP
jgi:preprotein translocase subunit SecD